MEDVDHPVLVVEDDSNLRVAVIAFLEASGYAAVGVGDGRQAFDLLQAGLRPLVILLDLSLPEMDGEHFRLFQLRHAGLALIPVLISSGRRDAEQIARSLRTAVVLRKPVDPEVLIHAIEEHARSARPASNAPRD